MLASTDGKRVLGRVTQGGKARIGRSSYNLYCLLGSTWGTLFTARRNGLFACTERTTQVEQDAGNVDNRTLHDNNTNQRLSEREITQLKQEGATGAALVNAVVANSATFAGKTRFSQEKYLKRKRDKFDVCVRVVRPTAYTLCETYFQRSPDKILHMRSDALGLLLGYGGVVPKRHVLVADDSIGLLTGAVAERLQGYGRVLNVFRGTAPPGIELLRMLNFSQSIQDSISHAPMDVIHMLDKWEVTDAKPIRYTAREEVELQQREQHLTCAKRAASIARRPERGLVKQWLKDKFDCLVVAVRNDVVELFDELIHHLAPSGTFTAYCTHFQEAAELQYALQMSKLAIRVEMIESMLTQHQMLPGRAHPQMTESATGGYVVSGIRIKLLPPEKTHPNQNSKR